VRRYDRCKYGEKEQSKKSKFYNVSASSTATHEQRQNKRRELLLMLLSTYLQYSMRGGPRGPMCGQPAQVSQAMLQSMHGKRTDSTRSHLQERAGHHPPLGVSQEYNGGRSYSPTNQELSCMDMQKFVDEECYKCGVLFGVSPAFQRNRKEGKVGFYCPNSLVGREGLLPTTCRVQIGRLSEGRSGRVPVPQQCLRHFQVPAKSLPTRV
jgi:hypothetical protein